jgi:DNA-binding beta-propeller fold protein YncE
MRKHIKSRIIFPLAAMVLICCGIVNFARTKAAGKPVPHKLYSPVRLAFNPESNLLVSDYRLGMILTVDRKSLEVKSWFQVEGRPLGVAWAKGRVFVGNSSKGCIEAYTRTGKKQYTLGGGSHPVNQPQDIAVDTKPGYLFAVDGSDKAVKIFDLKGAFIRTIPADDPEHSILSNPTAITLDTQQQLVYVSDYGDANRWIYPRVQVFDYEGNLIDTISGKAGMFGQRFSRPQGLALNESGQLFLLDCFASEILVFDPATGALLKTMSGFGTEPGQLQLPLDLVIHKKSDDIFVTNNRAARVEHFEKGGAL